MESPPKRITRSKGSPSTSNDLATLLERQKNDIIQSLKPELKTIVQKLTLLEDRITNLESNIASINHKHLIHDEKLTELTRDLNNVKFNIASETCDEIQQRLHRCKNVIISGLPGPLTGSVEERKSHDSNAVKNLLEAIEEDDSEILAMHRIGRPSNDGKTLLKVEFSSEEVKRKVLRKAKSLRQKEEFKFVYVNPDRTRLQQNEFKILRHQLKTRKESGEDVIIFKNKVVLRDSLQNFL